MSSRTFALAAVTVTILAAPCAGIGQSVESLTLEQAERLMQQRNRELQAARRAVEGARSNTTIAGARPNPTLSLLCMLFFTNFPEQFPEASYSREACHCDRCRPADHPGKSVFEADARLTGPMSHKVSVASTFNNRQGIRFDAID